MKRNLACLTDKGREIFKQYLSDLQNDSSLNPPHNILDNPTFCYNLNISKMTKKASERIVKLKNFSNKYDFAVYIYPIINDLSGIERENGFWDWLSLFYFDIICPATDNYRKKLRNAFYLHEHKDYRNVLKHHLAGTYLLYNRHKELSKPLLLDEMDKLSYFREQLISRKNFINCKPFVEVLGKLYFDESNQRLKKGVTKRINDRYGRKIPNAGTHRRLLHFEKRLERNYDFYTLSCEQILNMLPREFDEFKDNASATSEKIPLTEEMLEGGNQLNIELDGIRGVCRVDNLGTFSDRFCFKLEEKHPNFSDKENQTKYYLFTEPGVIQWRNSVKSKIYLIQD